MSIFIYSKSDNNNNKTNIAKYNILLNTLFEHETIIKYLLQKSCGKRTSETIAQRKCESTRYRTYKCNTYISRDYINLVHFRSKFAKKCSQVLSMKQALLIIYSVKILLLFIYLSLSIEFGIQ